MLLELRARYTCTGMHYIRSNTHSVTSYYIAGGTQYIYLFLVVQMHFSHRSLFKKFPFLNVFLFLSFELLLIGQTCI